MEKSLYFLLRLRLGDEGVSVGSGDTRLWMFGWSSTMDGEDNQTWMPTCFTSASLQIMNLYFLFRRRLGDEINRVSFKLKIFQ